MILPIGHENQEVRRLPWISLSIIAICLVAHFMVSRSMSRLEQEVRVEATRMLRYWAEHPYLEPDPDFLREVGISDTDLRRIQSMFPPVPAPETSVEIDDQQAEMDRMTDALISLRRRAPYYRWGLIPSRIEMPGLLTHMFVHGGWLHLLGNLLFLYLTGPFVEDIWGRWLYALFYLAMGLVSGLMFCLHYPHSSTALIGASGAIAAIMGAFLVYFWKTRIRFAFFFTFIFSGTFKAPAWMMLPLWAGLEFINAGAMDRVTGGRGGGTAHWAHVWGFVLGLTFALLLKWTRFVERRIAPALEKETGIRNPGLEAYEEGLKHLDKGRYTEARDCFVTASRANPGDLDILEYLELTTRHTGEADLYLRHAGRAIEARLGRRDQESALGMYQRLRQNFPVESLPLRAGALLVPHLLAAGEASDARALLRHIVDNADKSFPAGLVIPLVEPARRLGASIYSALASKLADRPDIPESVRGSLEMPLMPPVRQRQLRVTPAVPTRLGADRLLLRLNGEGDDKALDLSLIQAVGVAAITGAEKPLLLIDLFLDKPQDNKGRLRVIRLASDTFNPLSLIRTGTNPAQAFRAFVTALLEKSNARPWPDARILDIRRIPLYPDLESYQLNLVRGTD